MWEAITPIIPYITLQHYCRAGWSGVAEFEASFALGAASADQVIVVSRHLNEHEAEFLISALSAEISAIGLGFEASRAVDSAAPGLQPPPAPPASRASSSALTGFVVSVQAPCEGGGAAGWEAAALSTWWGTVHAHVKEQLAVPDHSDNHPFSYQFTDRGFPGGRSQFDDVVGASLRLSASEAAATAAAAAAATGSTPALAPALAPVLVPVALEQTRHQADVLCGRLREAGFVSAVHDASVQADVAFAVASCRAAGRPLRENPPPPPPPPPAPVPRTGPSAVPAAVPAAVPCRHGSGEWRGAERTQWCSLARSPDGFLCVHGLGPAPRQGEEPAIIKAPHWSCCGALVEQPPPPGPPGPLAPLVLRVRTAAGVKMLQGLTAQSLLRDLCAACEAALGGRLASLSFRGAAANVVLVREGDFTGAGPDAALGELGVTDLTTFMASVASGAATGLPEACAARRPTQRGALACEFCRGSFTRCLGSYGMRDGAGVWREEQSGDLSKVPESPNGRWCCLGCEQATAGPAASDGGDSASDDEELERLLRLLPGGGSEELRQLLGGLIGGDGNRLPRGGTKAVAMLPRLTVVEEYAPEHAAKPPGPKAATGGGSLAWSEDDLGCEKWRASDKTVVSLADLDTLGHPRCTICYDDFKPGDVVTTLGRSCRAVGCKAFFHHGGGCGPEGGDAGASAGTKPSEACGGIAAWLDSHNACPLCREELPKTAADGRAMGAAAASWECFGCERTQRSSGPACLNCGVARNVGPRFDQDGPFFRTVAARAVRRVVLGVKDPLPLPAAHHPFHPHRMVLTGCGVGWRCDGGAALGGEHDALALAGCRGANQGAGPRYRCTDGCDFDLCQACWDACGAAVAAPTAALTAALTAAPAGPPSAAEVAAWEAADMALIASDACRGLERGNWRVARALGLLLAWSRSDPSAAPAAGASGAAGGAAVAASLDGDNNSPGRPFAGASAATAPPPSPSSPSLPSSPRFTLDPDSLLVHGEDVNSAALVRKVCRLVAAAARDPSAPLVRDLLLGETIGVGGGGGSMAQGGGAGSLSAAEAAELPIEALAARCSGLAGGRFVQDASAVASLVVGGGLNAEWEAVNGRLEALQRSGWQVVTAVQLLRLQVPSTPRDAPTVLVI